MFHECDNKFNLKNNINVVSNTSTEDNLFSQSAIWKHTIKSNIFFSVKVLTDEIVWTCIDTVISI